MKHDHGEKYIQILTSFVFFANNCSERHDSLNNKEIKLFHGFSIAYFISIFFFFQFRLIENLEQRVLFFFNEIILHDLDNITLQPKNKN